MIVGGVVVTLCLLLLPFLLRAAGRLAGRYVRRCNGSRRANLIRRAQEDASGPVATPATDDRREDATHGWHGIIGFFHPYWCVPSLPLPVQLAIGADSERSNAGGGGERVLWTAIQATQRRWPNALSIVYTGDQADGKDAILRQVKHRFDISLDPCKVEFLFLGRQHYLLGATWPRFTLLCQSLGSMVVAYEAFAMLVPDVFVDTMGYAFASALCKALFPGLPTAAYVHYPTISTDMLRSLDAAGAAGDHHGLHARQGRGWRGQAKRAYWRAFAVAYGMAGASIDLVMANSSWTQGHLRELWGGRRRRHRGDIKVVFPPVAVERLAGAIEVSAAAERERRPDIIYIAQFRPEKNHTLVLNAFRELLDGRAWQAADRPRLILLGSVRDSEDATRVYKLRLLVHELKIKDSVQFVCDASWQQMLDVLRTCSVGVNAMWNEHFGIGVVEYQAAGLISVVNDSGGPKLDIVVDVDGLPTGFHASTSEEYALGLRRALCMPPEERVQMRLRARQNAGRFRQQAFEASWVENMTPLLR